MQKIYFQHDKEFIHCCELLFQNNKSLEIAWKRDKQWGNEMNVEAHEIDLQTWIHCFVMLYMSLRLGEKIKKITKEHYHYTEELEVNQIYDSTKTVLYDSYYNGLIFPENKTLYTSLFSLFELHIQNINNVHFDAFVLFCLKPIEGYLIKAVGFGIDEIKKEEFYQQFIVQVREVLQERQILRTELHIMEKDEVFLFRAKGMYYTKNELLNDTAFSSVSLQELEIENTYLAPILALAPEKIYVYSDRPIEGKVNTLYRIFQEDMTLLALDQFPFSK